MILAGCPHKAGMTLFGGGHDTEASLAIQSHRGLL
jgi:hypothetical protein